MTWWVSSYLQHFGAAYVLSWVVWVLGSIVLHELAHGWMAIRCGDRTPIELDRMTLNPLVHMGGMSLLMFALVGIAWGQMPVNPSRFKGRNDDALVAFAGPAVNLLLAISALLLGALWITFAGSLVPEQAYENLSRFFIMGVELNLVLLAFNLLPFPPLDGSSVLASYFAGYRRLLQHPNFGMISMAIFIVLFLRAFPYIWSAADFVTATAFETVLAPLA